MKQIHVRVEGRVQGVFFRDCTRREAESLGLQGWVKNLPDGSVEVVISGIDEDVDKMIRWLHSGSPHSIVTAVTMKKVAEIRAYSDFQILY